MKLSALVYWLSKPKNLWGSIFVYTVLAGIFVQLILLPHIFPAWHAGSGLLKGVDGPKFHKIALELSERIQEQGWGQWELLPDGQLVSGIAAICYTLIYPEPWSVLPINAVLNACACVCLYLMLAKLTGNNQIGLVAALPFMFYPSNLLWNTQFHNENFAVPGVVFILYGWLMIVNWGEKKEAQRLTGTLGMFLLIAFGSVLLGLVRDYILSGISYLFVASSIGLGIYWLTQGIRAREYLARLFIVSMACAVMLSAGSIKAFVNPGRDKTPSSTSDISSIPAQQWTRTSWLPTAMDTQLRELANYRRRFVVEWADGGSGMDLDVTFANAAEMLAYIPRSVQIGFLSPFPDLWFSSSKRDGGTAMRLISGMEMVVAYFCLLGLPLYLWAGRRQPAMWVIAFICAAMLVIYSMIVPNIGALYRFRYPYFMPLVCLGLTGWLQYGPQIISRFTGKQIS